MSRLVADLENNSSPTFPAVPSSLMTSGSHSFPTADPNNGHTGDLRDIPDQEPSSSSDSSTTKQPKNHFLKEDLSRMLDQIIIVENDGNSQDECMTQHMVDDNLPLEQSGHTSTKPTTITYRLVDTLPNEQSMTRTIIQNPIFIGDRGSDFNNGTARSNSSNSFTSINLSNSNHCDINGPNNLLATVDIPTLVPLSSLDGAQNLARSSLESCYNNGTGSIQSTYHRHSEHDSSTENLNRQLKRKLIEGKQDLTGNPSQLTLNAPAYEVQSTTTSNETLSNAVSSWETYSPQSYTSYYESTAGPMSRVNCCTQLDESTWRDRCNTWPAMQRPNSGLINGMESNFLLETAAYPAQPITNSLGQQELEQEHKIGFVPGSNPMTLGNSSLDIIRNDDNISSNSIIKYVDSNNNHNSYYNHRGSFLLPNHVPALPILSPEDVLAQTAVIDNDTSTYAPCTRKGYSGGSLATFNPLGDSVTLESLLRRSTEQLDNDDDLLPPFTSAVTPFSNFLPSSASAVPYSLRQPSSSRAFYDSMSGDKSFQSSTADLVQQDMTGYGETPSSSSSSRRNAWGNLSYADLITKAILTSPDKRLTLAQIYDWMVQYIPYFKDKGDNNSSAGWKNSIRHNLSLHNRFIRIQNEGAGKSSWWMINPEARITKPIRRRAATLDNTTTTPSKSASLKKRIRKRTNTNVVTSKSEGARHTQQFTKKFREIPELSSDVKGTKTDNLSIPSFFATQYKMSHDNSYQFNGSSGPNSQHYMPFLRQTPGNALIVHKENVETNNFQETASNSMDLQYFDGGNYTSNDAPLQAPHACNSSSRGDQTSEQYQLVNQKGIPQDFYHLKSASINFPTKGSYLRHHGEYQNTKMDIEDSNKPSNSKDTTNGGTYIPNNQKLIDFTGYIQYPENRFPNNRQYSLNPGYNMNYYDNYQNSLIKMEKDNFRDRSSSCLATIKGSHGLNKPRNGQSLFANPFDLGVGGSSSNAADGNDVISQSHFANMETQNHSANSNIHNNNNDNPTFIMSNQFHLNHQLHHPERLNVINSIKMSPHHTSTISYKVLDLNNNVIQTENIAFDRPSSLYVPNHQAYFKTEYDNDSTITNMTANRDTSNLAKPNQYFAGMEHQNLVDSALGSQRISSSRSPNHRSVENIMNSFHPMRHSMPGANAHNDSSGVEEYRSSPPLLNSPYADASNNQSGSDFASPQYSLLRDTLIKPRQNLSSLDDGSRIQYHHHTRYGGNDHFLPREQQQQQHIHNFVEGDGRYPNMNGGSVLAQQQPPQHYLQHNHNSTIHYSYNHTNTSDDELHNVMMAPDDNLVNTNFHRCNRPGTPITNQYFKTNNSVST